MSKFEASAPAHELSVLIEYAGLGIFTAEMAMFKRNALECHRQIRSEQSLNYHVILTRRCNLNCSYCHGGEEEGSATELQYSFDELEQFLEKDDDVQLMLYGGEPTIRIPLICELMDRFPDARFTLQTNGLHLNQIPPHKIERFHTILVSIDGTEAVTDGYRSKGVYQRVLQNVRWLDKTGFPGDIIARMTVSQQTDIYRDVCHLIALRNPYFDHVHWQLNVVWDAENNWIDFDSWVANSYNPGITKLVGEWVAKMDEGIVEGIVPFLPLAYAMLTGRTSRLRCGSGIDTFAIHTNGSIGVCPISPDWESTIVGNIRETEPCDIHDIMRISEPCPSCNEFAICGGRCLFANREKLWGIPGFNKICETVKHLISMIRAQIPEIKRLIDEGYVAREDFNYPRYNNGCEIIP